MRSCPDAGVQTSGPPRASPPPSADDPPSLWRHMSRSSQPCGQLSAVPSRGRGGLAPSAHHSASWWESGPSRAEGARRDFVSVLGALDTEGRDDRCMGFPAEGPHPQNTCNNTYQRPNFHMSAKLSDSFIAFKICCHGDESTTELRLAGKPRIQPRRPSRALPFTSCVLSRRPN